MSGSRRPAPGSRITGVARVASAALAMLMVTFVAILATGAPTAGRGTTAGGSATPRSPTTVSRVERALRDGTGASGIPSAAFAVVEERSTLTSRGLGETSGRPMTAGTPFVLGSSSKSFTALAVLQLVDAGQVALDDPVRRYVPELDLAAGQPLEAITVRHLLQQTSGIPATAGGPVLSSAVQGSAEDAVRELRGVRLAAAPGVSWEYSNANYVLAGLVVQRAAGMPYGQYVQTRIFRPLGMTHSYTAAGPAREAGLAPGHRYWFGMPVASGPVVREGLAAAGYLMSTAEDLGRYLAMYLADGVAADGTRIISAHGLATMLAPGPTCHLGSWAGGMESRYAMGWFVGGPWGQNVVFHPGDAPDTTTMIALVPRQGTAVATMVGGGHEIPVPGNPAITDQISSTVVQATLGEPVSAVPSIWRFYTPFDLIVVALVALATAGLVRALRTLRGPGAARRSRRVAGVLTYLVLAGMLVGLPFLTGFGWAAAWTWAPDLAAVVLLLTVLVTATAAVRLGAVVHSWRSWGPADQTR